MGSREIFSKLNTLFQEKSEYLSDLISEILLIAGNFPFRILLYISDRSGIDQVFFHFTKNKIPFLIGNPDFSSSLYLFVCVFN